MKVVSIVGMTGSGKSEVARMFHERGFAIVRFGDLSRIDAALKSSDVVIDGLYSWEEYVFLKTHYGEDFIVVAVWSSPANRYARLGSRKERKLTPKEAASRDHAEIEKINKGGPIAMADFTIMNESSLTDLKKEVEKVISKLK